MTTNGIPVGNLISIGINLSPTAAQGQTINSAMVLGTSTVIDTTSRYRIYPTLAALAADFPNTSPEYLAGVLWFEQLPQPTSLVVGRWCQTAAASELVGALVPAANQVISVWIAITSGGFLITLDGATYAVTGLNFGAVTNMNGVAAVIQTALAALLANTTCVWSATYQNFTITSGATGVASTVSFLAVPTAVGTATFAAQPAANDTITIAGTAITFVSSAPTGAQVLIGSSVTVTLANLLTYLNASGPATVKCSVSGSVLYVVAATAGSGGNAITLAKSSTNITLSGTTLAGGSATDVSALLGMQSSSSGAYSAPGVAAESALTAVQLLDGLAGNQWYGLVVPAAADSDHLAIAAYIEADSTKHYYGVTTQEAGALVASVTSDIAYQLQQLKYNHTGVQYSSSNPYAVVSMLARILTTQWGGNNTVITLAYKTEPGIVAETLNQSQLTALKGKNANAVVNMSDGTAILYPIVTSASGQPVDTIIGLDWFAIQLQTDLFNDLYSNPTKIPQTDPGVHVLLTTIAGDCEEAVRNGLFAPGVWQQPGFGAISNGSILSAGYYVFAPPVASQSQAVRATRVSPTIQIGVCLAGSIEFVNAQITVNI